MIIGVSQHLLQRRHESLDNAAKEKAIPGETGEILELVTAALTRHAATGNSLKTGKCRGAPSPRKDAKLQNDVMAIVWTEAANRGRDGRCGRIELAASIDVNKCQPEFSPSSYQGSYDRVALRHSQVPINYFVGVRIRQSSPIRLASYLHESTPRAQ